MNRFGLCWIYVAACLVGSAFAEEPIDVVGEYQQIVADYQRIVGATENASARAAAGRLTRTSYRRLIEMAEGVENFSADDLHALGQCHEAIGETDEARAFYVKSLAAKPQARTQLSLARADLRNDLKAADAHFAKAVELDPAYPDLNRFRLSLAAAHQSRRDWNGAVPYLEHLLAYTKTRADRTPASTRWQVSHEAVQKQLDRMRRFAGMMSQAAPDLKTQQWAQGAAIELAGLKGKVVLVDFCAIWAKPSHERMELLKELQQDGVEIIGVTLAYKHKYDAETDKVTVADDLTPKDEAAGVAAFAKKHEIPWRLAIIDRETVDQYGVVTLPHTVVLDKQGKVVAILLGGDKAAKDLETIVKGLLE